MIQFINYILNEYQDSPNQNILEIIKKGLNLASEEKENAQRKYRITSRTKTPLTNKLSKESMQNKNKILNSNSSNQNKTIIYKTNQQTSSAIFSKILKCQNIMNSHNEISLKAKLGTKNFNLLKKGFNQPNNHFLLEKIIVFFI